MSWSKIKKEWEKEMRQMEREEEKKIKRFFGSWNHNHTYSKIKQ